MFDDQSSIAGISDISLEDFLDKENTNIFSDPESEWNTNITNDSESFEATDLRPESDQPQDSIFNKPYTIPVLSYENIDEI